MRHNQFFLFVCLAVVFVHGLSKGEDGYRLWLRYDQIKNEKLLSNYSDQLGNIVMLNSYDNTDVICKELQAGLQGLLGKNIPLSGNITKGSILLITRQDLAKLNFPIEINSINEIGSDGYIIQTVIYNKQKITVIGANNHSGFLYGVFELLRQIQTNSDISNLKIKQNPQIQLRLLNHWDNLNGSIERGYAGKSIWQWELLPDKINPRIKDYARANASIGINGIVLNNVNAQAEILRKDYIEKASVIANELRPYGIKIYFSIKFTSPQEVGHLSTSDPLAPEVINWWNAKASEIYSLIPDFGGFLVKAYSEGQPGPQQYGRSHAEGANVLANALKPYNGKVMWRSFVYDMSIDSDRTKCAYLEFLPLDGLFANNVFVQTKNGPIDFQPREPFSPLFGAMPNTPLTLELQITQEYTGQAKHLVYLGPQWKEVLDSDTYAYGKGSTIAKIIDGSVEHHRISSIAGVGGFGSDRNWCGHHFSQSNWYAFGRLAWDCSLSSEQIADEVDKNDLGQ